MKILTISIILQLTVSSKTEEINKKYILNTARCKLPDINPLSREVMSIMQPQPYQSCNASELLTFVAKTSDNLATIYIREDLIPQYSTKNISCCFSHVTRRGTPDQPDVGIEISECRHFQKKLVLTGDTVKVTCYEDVSENQTKIVYENVHNAITTRAVQKKLQNMTKKISVLFIVVDSISRLNFIRAMNQTYGYLKENNFIEMKGYTKVAENTFPNFVALLTGLGLSEMYKKCEAGLIGGMDRCPLIWYDYGTEGYITAYAEDDAHISTFNYKKKGFLNPPTDYYFKPYIEASETLNLTFKYSMPYCTGPETSGERILNLAKDFATTFQNQSTFGIFWMNTFSHDDINAPYLMDGKMKKFFSDLKSEGVLDDNIVILLSDHGIRFGDIRATRSGWLEERMPLNMISLPEKFQSKFRRAFQNLKNNSDKLTSTYDLFLTLEHILTLSGTNYESRQSSACPNCSSLFKKIRKNRSCQDAGIPSRWCPCVGHFNQIDNNHKHVRNAIDLIIQKINPMLSSSNATSPELDEIVSASISDTENLFLVFRTNNPPETFLATVKFQENVTAKSTFVITPLSNSYTIY